MMLCFWFQRLHRELGTVLAGNKNASVNSKSVRCQVLANARFCVAPTDAAKGLLRELSGSPRDRYLVF